MHILRPCDSPQAAEPCRNSACRRPLGESGFGGMERWNGMMEWTTGMEYWNAPPTTAPIYTMSVVP